jgi:HEAT-like repeat
LYFDRFCNPTGALGEEPVRELYPELLKRLDDSNDSVRKAVCATLAAFFRATPPGNVKGTVLDYSSDQLLVHLDDQDPAVQVRYLPLTNRLQTFVRILIVLLNCIVEDACMRSVECALVYTIHATAVPMRCARMMCTSKQVYRV